MAHAQPKTLLAGAIVSTVLLGAAPVATLQAHDDDHDSGKRSFRIALTGYQEVLPVSTAGQGQFRARISADEKAISYELSYSGLEGGEVRQAHIHFAQKGVNGPISVFLCQTATNPDPTGLAPQCPQPGGTVTGMLTAANMIGGAIVAQGIAVGEFGELIKAIRAGRAYANVHTATWLGGEIRGQLK
jgi:hypothetical protein